MKAKAKCKKCGSTIEIDTSLVLTSNPPKYKGECKSCNTKDYFLVEEIYYIPEKLSELPSKYGDCESNSIGGVQYISSLNGIKQYECNHMIDVKYTSNGYVTYCLKCGKIFDTKQCSFNG